MDDLLLKRTVQERMFKHLCWTINSLLENASASTKMITKPLNEFDGQWLRLKNRTTLTWFIVHLILMKSKGRNQTFSSLVKNTTLQNRNVKVTLILKTTRNMQNKVQLKTLLKFKASNFLSLMDTSVNMRNFDMNPTNS